MALDEPQLSAVNAILQVCATECCRSALGNLLEGHLKVVALEALLRGGYSVLESANLKGHGRVLSLQGGRLNAAVDARPSIAALADSGNAKMSPDIRVWAPCRLVVELQVRSCFGSQSALFSENLFDDLSRVGNSRVDAFVLAADRPIYDQLCGIKANPRGRKPKYAEIIKGWLPTADSLSPWNAQHAWAPVARIGGFANVAGALVSTPFGIERCVIGVWRAA